MTKPKAVYPKTKIQFIHSPVWMVLVGLVARVLYIVIAHSYRFSSAYWSNFEMANLAYSLAMGHGFSSPFGGDTGPSAWTAPLYPWVISLAFRAFGIYSYAAAFAMLVFNSVFAALTSWTIYRIARRVFNETVAVWSGWVWALLPYSIYWSVSWIWETSLSAFLLSLLFMLTLEMEGDARLWSWFGYGLLWGIVGLTNTSVLAWLPFSGCWLAYQLHRRGKRSVVPVVLSAVVFWLTLMPWLARNYSLFGKLVFVRGDLGAELRVGNNPLADGGWVPAYHPGTMAFSMSNTRRWAKRHSTRTGSPGERMDRSASEAVPGANLAQVPLLLGWYSAERAGADQEPALSRIVATGNRRTIAGRQTTHAWRFSVCHADGVLSADLLLHFPDVPVPACHRSGTGDPCNILAQQYGVSRLDRLTNGVDGSEMIVVPEDCSFIQVYNVKVVRDDNSETTNPACYPLKRNGKANFQAP